MDRDLRYRFVNQAARAAAGGALDEAVGSHVTDVLPRRVAEPLLLRVEAVLRDGQPITRTFRSTLPSDPMPGRTWRAHYVPVHDSHGAVDSVVILGDDVTESEQLRERMETELAATSRVNLMLDTQREMIEQVAAGASMQEVLESVVHRLERHLERTAYVSVLLYDAERGILRHGVAPSLPTPYNEAIDGIAVGPRVGSCGTAVHRGEPVIVSNISRDPLWSEFRDLAASHGLAACWSMPVRDAHGDLVGTVAVYHPEPASPTGDDLQLCELFTRTVGAAIERVEGRERTHRERRIIETLHEVGRAISAHQDLGEIVQVVTERCTELTKAQFGAFFYNAIDDQGEQYTLYTIAGVPRSKFERFPMPRNTKIFEPTFRGLGTVRSHDITEDPNYGQNAPYRGMPRGHLPVHSYLAVPVKLSDESVAGGLFFGHDAIGVFTEEHERLVEGIAEQAAIAIENARLRAAERIDRT